MALLRTTFLERLGPPKGPAIPPPMPGLAVSKRTLSVDDYLDLFQAVGGPLGWDGRSKMSHRDLAAFLDRPTTDIFVLTANGIRAGFCEFGRARPPDSEIVYFGLIPSMQGMRLGPYLLDTALRSHWREHAPNRIWLHTDVWDGPKALDTYRRAGFRVFGERFIDEEADADDCIAALKTMPASLPSA